ncbi:RNA polymerase sigma factor SigM [Kribbella sp. NPDC003557]|uniref:RNA polymerase sigma factor SigM n=1 Tax=Kribbella sp. NPDC003557 TaxID=3154449 RepID=UPI0033AE4990
MTAHVDSGNPPPRPDVPRIGADDPVPQGAVQPAPVDGPVSYDQLDDHELLRMHVAGNPDSFGFLVKRHRDRMWAVAIRTLGEPEEAADALQEAFISAFRRADSFRGDAKVTTWLHRIVVNACLDRIRRRQVRAADPLPEDEDRAAELAGPSEDDPAEVRERRLDVLNALKQINEDQRAALVLVDMEGYSIEEAAAILDCAPGTVKSRCARGRAKLLPLLRHWQTTRESDAPDKSAAEAVGTE